MTTPNRYTPRSPSILDNIGYTQRVVDAILRNNPLTDATVSEGLIRWLGNYTNSGNSDPINFLWIGEFFPADVNRPGNPPQRGISMVRDDSRGGVSAFAIFDDNPSGGGGLRQTIRMTSGDNKLLALEHRNGGWRWPEENVVMGPVGSNTLQWIGTNSGSFDTLYEGRASLVGNNLHFRLFGATTNGAAGEFRFRAQLSGGDVVSPTYTLGVNSASLFDSNINVAAGRGTTVAVRFEARVTNGVGEARGTPISVRCFTS